MINSLTVEGTLDNHLDLKASGDTLGRYWR